MIRDTVQATTAKYLTKRENHDGRGRGKENSKSRIAIVIADTRLAYRGGWTSSSTWTTGTKSGMSMHQH
jgi:hypothetical protein